MTGLKTRINEQTKKEIYKKEEIINYEELLEKGHNR